MKLIRLLLCLICLPVCAAEPHHLAKRLDRQKESLNSQAIARILWAGLGLPEDSDYMEQMIQGMRAADHNEPHTISDNFLEVPLYAYGLAIRDLQGKQNLTASDQYFVDLAADEQLQTLKSHHLYYRTLKAGEGEQFDKNVTHCTANYSVSVIEETSQEFPYHRSSRKESLTVGDLIPGMRYGMLGMLLGERREILVHPTLAYGFDAMFEPGVSLKVIVELLSIEKEGSESLPPLASQKLAVPEAIQNVSEEKVAALFKEMGFEEGWICWNHFKQANEYYSLDQVVNNMQQIARGETEGLPFDQAREIFSDVQILIGCRKGS